MRRGNIREAAKIREARGGGGGVGRRANTWLDAGAKNTNAECRALCQRQHTCTLLWRLDGSHFWNAPQSRRAGQDHRAQAAAAAAVAVSENISMAHTSIAARECVARRSAPRGPERERDSDGMLAVCYAICIHWSRKKNFPVSLHTFFSVFFSSFPPFCDIIFIGCFYLMMKRRKSIHKRQHTRGLTQPLSVIFFCSLFWPVLILTSWREQLASESEVLSNPSPRFRLEDFLRQFLFRCPSALIVCDFWFGLSPRSFRPFLLRPRVEHRKPLWVAPPVDGDTNDSVNCERNDSSLGTELMDKWRVGS